MKLYEERLIKERGELMKKLEKLSHFIATIPVEHKHYELLTQQQIIMQKYIQILDARLTIK